jgi:hypothetical protein
VFVGHKHPTSVFSQEKCLFHLPSWQMKNKIWGGAVVQISFFAKHKKI